MARIVCMFVCLVLSCLASSQAMAFSSYSCGKEGQTCNFQGRFGPPESDPSNIDVMAYGINGVATNLMVSGISQVNCGVTSGDPVPMVAKVCVAVRYDLPEIGGWQDCGTTVSNRFACMKQRFKPNHFRIARFGGADRYFYMPVSQGIICQPGFEEVRVLPAQGELKCSLSSVDIPSSGNLPWAPCGSVSKIERAANDPSAATADCQFPFLGTYLIRAYDRNLQFAGQVNYVHRVVTGRKYACSEQTLGVTARSGPIACEFLPLPQIAKVEGSWEIVGTCENCGDIEYKVTTGVERGTTREKESAWTEELTASVETEAFGFTGSVSSTVSRSGRNLLAESFAASAGTEYTVSCDKGALWQWVTRVENACLPGNPDCEAVARSKEFLCLSPDLKPGVEAAKADQFTMPADGAAGEAGKRRPPRRFKDCGNCPLMTEVPGGTFMMGSPDDEEGRRANEGPQREVTIEPFAVGVFEVTFAQWEECFNDGGCSMMPPSQVRQSKDFPVYPVSWFDGQEYAAWLSKKTGKTYRLLTEAEWEYAARAGTSTPFPFGDFISDGNANYDATTAYQGGDVGMKRGYTTEVGSFNPNGFGLYDMTGNASEWTEDCLSKYAESAADGRAALGPVAKTRSCERVLRGGSINDSPSAVRSAARFPLTAYLRYDINGLRVAQTLGPVQKAGD